MVAGKDVRDGPKTKAHVEEAEPGEHEPCAYGHNPTSAGFLISLECECYPCQSVFD